MDRSADIILQEAFLKLESFTIPGLGTFTRPKSRRHAGEILWGASDAQAYSLIDYLKEHEGKSASEAEAIQANIRVALRSSMRLRKQYYIQNAGTIKQRGSHISFTPEPAVIDHWFPQEGKAIVDDAVPVGPSNVKRIIVGSILVAFVLIVASGFWFNTRKPEPPEKAKVIAGNDTPIDTAAQALLDMPVDSATAIEDTPKEEQEEESFLPEKSDFTIVPMEQIALRRGDNSDTLTANYHLIVAVFSDIEDAENFCSKSVNYPESCQFLEHKTEEGNMMYRVSVFRTTGSKSARQRRSLYRNGKYPGCWVLPKLPN